MRVGVLALAAAVGAMLAAAPVAAQQCPPGTEFIPAGYGKKAKWLQARCVPLYSPAAPASRSPAGGERATTRRLNSGELGRVQAR